MNSDRMLLATDGKRGMEAETCSELIGLQARFCS